MSRSFPLISKELAFQRKLVAHLAKRGETDAPYQAALKRLAELERVA